MPNDENINNPEDVNDVNTTAEDTVATTGDAEDANQPIHLGDVVSAGVYDETDTFNEDAGVSTQQILNMEQQIMDIGQQIQANGQYIGPVYNKKTGHMEMTQLSQRAAKKLRNKLLVERDKLLNIPWSDRHQRGFAAFAAAIVRAIKYALSPVYRRAVKAANEKGITAEEQMYEMMKQKFMEDARQKQPQEDHDKNTQHVHSNIPTEEHQKVVQQKADEARTAKAPKPQQTNTINFDEIGEGFGFQPKDEFNGQGFEQTPTNPDNVQPQKKLSPRDQLALQYAQQLIETPADQRMNAVFQMAGELEQQQPFHSKTEITPGKRQAKALMAILKPAMQQDPALCQVFVDCMAATSSIKEKEQQVNLYNYLTTLAIDAPQVFQYIPTDNRAVNDKNLTKIVDMLAQDLEKKPSLSAQQIFEKFAAMPESADRTSTVGRLLDKGVEKFALDMNSFDQSIPSPVDEVPVQTEPVEPYAGEFVIDDDPMIPDEPDFNVFPTSPDIIDEPAQTNAWDAYYQQVDRKINEFKQLTDAQCIEVASWVMASQQPELAVETLAHMVYPEDALVPINEAKQILSLLMFTDMNAVGNMQGMEKCADALISTIDSYADENTLKEFVNEIFSACNSSAAGLAELCPPDDLSTVGRINAQMNLLQNANATQISDGYLKLLADAIDDNNRQLIQAHNQHHPEHPWPVGKVLQDDNGQLVIKKKGTEYSIDALLAQDFAARTQDVQTQTV